jgi:hypothetical protein
MAENMPKQARQEIFLIRSDGGQFWDGRTWVNDMRKAEVFCNSSDVHSALVLMCSDENRSVSNVVNYWEETREPDDQIRIQYHNDAYDMVHHSELDRLITDRQIKRFLRYSEGWVTLGSHPVRGSSTTINFTGLERRRETSAGYGRP